MYIINYSWFLNPPPPNRIIICNMYLSPLGVGPKPVVGHCCRHRGRSGGITIAVGLLLLRLCCGRHGVVGGRGGRVQQRFCEADTETVRLGTWFVGLSSVSEGPHTDVLVLQILLSSAATVRRRQHRKPLEEAVGIAHSLFCRRLWSGVGTVDIADGTVVGRVQALDSWALRSWNKKEISLFSY
jgi:hypothetical protein